LEKEKKRKEKTPKCLQRTYIVQAEFCYLQHIYLREMFFLNKNVTGKLEKGGGGNPVPRAPVE
jgi:hypothetical protein